MILTALALIAATPQTIVTVDPKHRLIEGVASDGETIFVSSVLDRTILACRKTCKIMAVLPKGLHPMGIAWDKTLGALWVAADCPQLPGIERCERGALLTVFRSGKINQRFAPNSGEFHPGDVSVGPLGPHVSDSSNGVVYRLLHSGPWPIVKSGIGKSAQGSAVDPSGKRLIIADYSQGIASIDLTTGARTLLPRQDGKPLRGVDGLTRCGDTYFGIYNGAAPGRLLTIKMRPGGLEYGELIEGLELPDPTQVAFDGKRLLIVADSGWEMAMKGTPRDKGAPILAIPLGKDCNPL